MSVFCFYLISLWNFLLVKMIFFERFLWIIKRGSCFISELYSIFVFWRLSWVFFNLVIFWVIIFISCCELIVLFWFDDMIVYICKWRCCLMFEELRSEILSFWFVLDRRFFLICVVVVLFSLVIICLMWFLFFGRSCDVYVCFLLWGLFMCLNSNNCVVGLVYLRRFWFIEMI